MTPEQRELKTCPFCGGAARIESNRDWHRLYADHDEDCALYDANDLLMFPAQPGYLKEIADLWNRRAQVEALTVPDNYFAPVALNPTCACAKCNPNAAGRMMILCSTCGNKRCPHATDHRLACTDSNEPGQPGSSYGPTIPAIPGTKEGA